MARRALRIVAVWLLAIARLTAAGAAGAAGPAAVGLSGPPPRLVVVISIDQFRGDYLTRFADLWLPAVGVTGEPGQKMPGKVGGFRYLMERGAYFTDARHDHYPLFTGPGHAVLLTGAPPYKSGIVGNSWFDRELGRRRYCVGDDASPLVGAAVAAGETGATRAAGTAGATGAAPDLLGVLPPAGSEGRVLAEAER